MFFAVENLTQRSLTPCSPWEFKSDNPPSEVVRKDKIERQNWYRTVSVKWNFYTPIEATNPNQRPSKDNPPRFLHGLAVDYDAPIPETRVQEVISAMQIKPVYTERSLGGNVRLVWLFDRPIPLDGYDFCVYLLDKMREWLSLDMLPALDAGALTDPTRLLCNGADWQSTGASAVNEQAIQSFYVEAGKEFRFVASDSVDIPLDLVEAALRERFPNFDWPSEFTVESQGPSFWIPESVSPMSAIVKKDGMFSFSAHATKPFYSWSDILGADFAKQFVQKAIVSATDDIWWDGKQFWKRENGKYIDMAMPELTLFFKVDCRLSAKPGKGGVSQIDTALRHIQSANRISGAAPFVYYPPGVFDYQNERKLNTCMIKVLPPADGSATWGPSGEFPWLSEHFDNFFDPQSQLPFFLAWWKAFYESGLNQKPMPGQNIFLMGGANVGKTMTSHAIIGKSVGGFMDAAKHLTTNSDFNSELPEKPLWTIDDETMGESPRAQSNFAATWKKAAANQNIRCHKKYGIPVMTVWMGRIVATSNLDAVSSRILGPMDNNSLDKTSLFRCADSAKRQFPNRYELVQIIDRELPFFLRWLVNWNPLEQVLRDVRYGFRSYHEESLLDKAHQSGKAAPFKELLVEVLQQYFDSETNSTEWRGTLTQVMRLLQTNPLNDSVLRTLRLEQTSRYLESLQREGILQSRTEMGPLKTRIWVFPRFNINADPTPPPVAMPTQQHSVGIFTR